MKSLPEAPASRQGIALVAVLSFLGILLVLAVALVTMVRTERMVSESAKDDAGARIFLKGCIYAAMDDLSDVLWNGTTKNIRVDPSMAVIESQSAAAALGPNTGIVEGEVTNWLQRKYYAGLDPNFDAGTIAENARWINVTDPVMVNGKNPLLGRFVYIAMENSGSYDVNLVATGGLRRFGLSIGEVSNLPDFSVTLLNTFRQNRSDYGRFATIGEISALNPGPVNPLLLDNLVPYSLCYDAGWFDWASLTWSNNGAYGAPRDIRRWSEADAQAAFAGVGFSNSVSADLGREFQDFVDADFLPGGTTPATGADIPTAEPIPMINEITAQQFVTKPNATTLVNTVIIEVEVWYPYVGVTNTSTYTVRLTNSPSWWTFVPPIFTPVLAASKTFVNNPATPIQVITFTNVATVDISTGTPASVNNPFFQNVRVEMLDGATVVDRTTNQNNKTLRSGNLLLNGASFPILTTKQSVQVLDPRVNHLGYTWDKLSITSIGQTNDGLSGFGISKSTSTREGTEMYSRNGTNLDSVAELGYLSVGQPWTTIDLFTEKGRQLLSRFRTDSVTTKYYTNGFVNPNTLSTSVLEAAFSSAPIELYPGENPPTFGTVDLLNGARPLAQSVMSVTTNLSLSGSNTYDSAAGWVISPAFIDGSLTAANLRDNNQKESLIRNSYRLFNPNQNLFTLIVLAQTVKDLDGQGDFDVGTDEVTGEKRAVAVVWRDPFPNAEGRHETFIRLFRYLDE